VCVSVCVCTWGDTIALHSALPPRSPGSDTALLTSCFVFRVSCFVFRVVSARPLRRAALATRSPSRRPSPSLAPPRHSPPRHSPPPPPRPPSRESELQWTTLRKSCRSRCDSPLRARALRARKRFCRQRQWRNLKVPLASTFDILIFCFCIIFIEFCHCTL
jgi:hypothetical protein